MWVFTTHGFYSVVCTSDDHSVVLVRARDSESLEKLIDFLNEGDAGGKYTSENIIVTPYRDYPYRIAALRTDWVQYLERYAYEELSYPNFMGACSRAGMNAAQLGALGDVCGTMYYDWAPRPDGLDAAWVS
jgi:hypothetical protein